MTRARRLFISLSVTFGLATLVLFADAKPGHSQAPMKFMGPEFSKLLCESMNQTGAKKGLGRQGTGWIDSMDKKGEQVLVMGRRDCTGWTPMRFVWKADAQGDAVCVEARPLKKGDSYNWAMAPTTPQWVDFSDGFGVFDMPKVMKGFQGSYASAMNNIANFNFLFATTGYLAFAHQVDWSCNGTDMKEVNEAIADVDKADMKALLKGSAFLK